MIGLFSDVVWLWPRVIYAGGVLFFLADIRYSFSEDSLNPPVPFVSDEARTTLDMAISAREKLRSGVFQAAGYREIVHVDGRPPKQFPSQMSCHFDYGAGCWRYENHETQVISVISSLDSLSPDNAKANGDTKQNEGLRPRETVAYYARTPEYMVQWFSYGREAEPDHVTTNLEFWEPGKNPITFFLHPFSPSAPGFMNWNDLEMGNTASQIIDTERTECESIDSEVDQAGKVRLRFNRKHSRKEVLIDPEQGYAPIQMSIYAPTETGDKPSVPHDGSEESFVSWKLQNETWVPVHFKVSKAMGSGFTHSFSFDLSWETVNPIQIDPSVFTYQSFHDVWDGVQVFERRGGKAEHLATIGREFIQMTPVAEPLKITQTIPDRRTWTFWFLLINLFVGTGLVYAVLRRRKSDAP